MEDIAQLIFFIVMVLIYSIGAILKKANEWIDQKRMQVDRHPARQEKEVIHEGWPPEQTAPTQAAPQPQPHRDIAREIFEQFEMMLPPEIQEARRKAKELAQQQQQQTMAATPVPAAAKPQASSLKPALQPKPVQKVASPAPPRQAHTADQHYAAALRDKPILQQLGVNTPSDLRHAFLMQEILRPPLADRPPTPYFE